MNRHPLANVFVFTLIACVMQVTGQSFAQKPGADKIPGDSLLKARYSRTSDEAFQGAVDLAAGISEEASDVERMQLFVKAGAWSKVADLLREYDPEVAHRIHMRIVLDLNGTNPRAVMLPLDVVRLADASPVDLDNRQNGPLGRMLFLALQGNESRAELMAVLKKGTPRLGGTDPNTRRAAAALLASAELWAEAKEFGLKESDIPRGVVLVDSTPPPVDDPTWEQLLEVLRKPPADETERTETLERLYQTLSQFTPDVAKTKLSALINDRSQQQVAAAVLAIIGQRTARAMNEVDFNLRKANLELQQVTMTHLAAKTSLQEAPWLTLANLYARNWLAEAQFTLKTFPVWQKAAVTTRDRHQHVALEDVLKRAPADAWLAALLPQLSGTVKTTQARLIMISDHIDRVIPIIRDFVGEDPKLAAELANSYLATWAARHNPNLSPDALKQYRLDNQAIVLTRLEQEASLKQLGQLLETLDAPTRRLLDQDRVVLAFDICHSKAEIYTREHITTVFGALDKLPPPLLLTLFERMRVKLALNWRDLSIQRDAATKRTTADVLKLVNNGYAEANEVAQQWLAAHADDWRMNCTAGSLLADWAEFAYFEAVATENDDDRFAVYLKRTGDALARFRASSKAYAAQLPKMKRSAFELLPYRAWFYGLLGLSHDSDVNLRKGVTKEGLQEIRRAMLDLPGGAGEVHLELFSAMVADNVQQNRIAPEMKFRYLSSAVQITGRRPTIYPAEEKVQYYNSLLEEIRLETRLDGSDKIHPGTEFGVFVSLVHTADIARESGGFSKYLMNKVRRTVSGKSITEEPFYRDRFEEALRLSLNDFFDVRTIVFADPNLEAREYNPSEKKDKDATSPNAKESKRDWQETSLAYLLLIAKDPTVDRVPPLEIELDFFDREGKVVIPVPSTPILIEVAAEAPAARPAANLSVTQIVDSRELAGQRLKMDVVVTAQGLVPDLPQLLELEKYSLKVERVEPREGLLIRELHSGPEGLYAVSERSWTVHFDPAPLLRGAKHRIDFEFPQAKPKDIEVNYRTYDDVDPVEAAATVTLSEGAEVEKIAQTNYFAWGVGGFASLAAILLAGIVVFWKGPKPVETQAPAFEIPRDVTPFSIVALLHRIQSSPKASLSDEQRQELRRDIATLEQASFARQGASMSTQELTLLAHRWLKIVVPTAH
jgi:hypothetical protein